MKRSQLWHHDIKEKRGTEEKEANSETQEKQKRDRLRKEVVSKMNEGRNRE